MFAIYIEARPQEYELIEEIASDHFPEAEGRMKQLEAARPGRYEIRDLGEPPKTIRKARK